MLIKLFISSLTGSGTRGSAETCGIKTELCIRFNLSHILAITSIDYTSGNSATYLNVTHNVAILVELQALSRCRQAAGVLLRELLLLLPGVERRMYVAIGHLLSNLKFHWFLVIDELGGTTFDYAPKTNYP